MFVIILFALNAILFAYILLYGICLFCLPFIRPHKRLPVVPKQDEASEQNITVTVLIPCHHEGEGIVRTVQSVIDQDFAGKIEAIILIKDTQDSSFEPLKQHFGFEWKPKDTKKKVFSSQNRTVELKCLGIAPKREKLNAVLPEVKSEFLGFLDADHQAEPSWIAQSVAKLADPQYVGVQSRRAPLSLATLPQLWDSAQNHIGNELVNRALDRVVGAVFFTGTTCVFRAKDIEGMRFGDSVSEDTYFSYELLSQKQFITYNPEIGSREEVAPDLRSYVARRRRWSCGHNKTFCDLVPKILRTDLPWRNKTAAFIHGLFYTVPVAVCVLLNIFALHLFVQYTDRIRVLVVLFTLCVSLFISLLMFGWHRSIRRETVAVFIMLLPQAVLFSPMVLTLLDHELAFFLISFPYAYYIFWSHSFCLFAPLILLIIGSRKISVLSRSQMFTVVISYPLFFLLDIYAVLLGFIDFLVGKPTWAKINRTHADAAMLEKDSASARLRIIRWVGGIITSILLVICINDLTAYSNCGQPITYFFEPIFFTPSSELDWELTERKQMLEGQAGVAQIDFVSKIKSEQKTAPILRHFIDGQPISSDVSQVQFIEKILQADNSSLSIQFPPGWGAHSYSAKLKNGDEFCERDRKFTTTVRELRGKDLYVNGELFLIKGVIPSFSPKQTELSVEKGLSQIKELGANTLRFYHEMLPSQKQEAEKNNLLVIDQPNRSTWDEVNLVLPWQRIMLRDRFSELVERELGNPYLLFHTLGNELEIRNPNISAPYLVDLMSEVNKELKDSFYSYSTFFVYLKLPAAIYGVNMLDSSETYWKSGLDSIKLINKPFYASEFGGFVAAFERTPEELRAYRIIDYWQRIEQAGGMGIVFHQSHDNWLQPVVDGFNDPFSADQPDDERGIWRPNNEPKVIKRFVEMLFSDLEVVVPDKPISHDSNSYTVVLKNKRAYTLEDLRVFRGSEALFGPISLGPKAHTELVIARRAGDVPQQSLKAKYTTHRGLSMISQLDLVLPLPGATPVVINPDAVNLSTIGERVSGSLLRSAELKLVAPAGWQSVQVNGKSYPTKDEIVKVELTETMRKVSELASSSDGVNWTAVNNKDIGAGPQRVRFKLPPNTPDDAILLLAGLATRKFHYRYGDGQWIEASSHNYRENLLTVGTVRAGAPEGAFIYLLLPRTVTEFISSKKHPTGKQVDIEFEMPRVFSPPRFEVARG